MVVLMGFYAIFYLYILKKINTKIRIAKIQNLRSKQTELLGKVKSILDQSKISGVYKGEDKKHYKEYLQDYLQLMKNISGDRAIVNEKIHKLMEEEGREKVQRVLDRLKMNLKFDDDIYKIKYMTGNYLSKGLIKDYDLLTSKISKNKETIKDLKRNSPLRTQIVNGMKYPSEKKKKKGKKPKSDVEIEKFIANLVNGKSKGLIALEKQLIELEKKIELDEQTQNYLKFREMFKPWFEMWENIDKKIGAESNVRGSKFESSYCDNGIHLIVEDKLHKKPENCMVIRNLDWDCKEGGEVDILVTEKKNVNNIFCIIECKARCFDIGEGFAQGYGKIRKAKKKLYVKFRGEKIKVPYDTPNFVMTCLPKQDYHMLMASKLKIKMNKLVGKPDSSMTEEESYQELSKIFGNSLSPLDWYEKYADDYLIVLDKNSSW